MGKYCVLICLIHGCHRDFSTNDHVCPRNEASLKQIYNNATLYSTSKWDVCGVLNEDVKHNNIIVTLTLLNQVQQDGGSCKSVYISSIKSQFWQLQKNSLMK